MSTHALELTLMLTQPLFYHTRLISWISSCIHIHHFFLCNSYYLQCSALLLPCLSKSQLYFKDFLFICLLISFFIYFWLCWGLCCCTWAFCSRCEWGLLFSFGAHAWASHCRDFSCCAAQALGHSGFSSCSTWAQWLQLLGSRAQAQ